MAPSHTSKSEVRNLTNITDTDLLPDSELDTLITKANEKADREFRAYPKQVKQEAALYWACNLVARKLRGATAVEQDDTIRLRAPEEYREDYYAIKEKTEPSTSNVASRAG